MLPWNRRRFEEYERFTLGKARIVTNYPVSLVISPEWRPTSRYSAFGGFCNQVMSFWFGSSESRVEVTYKIVIYRWFFDIFKNEPEVIKKVICHNWRISLILETYRHTRRILRATQRPSVRGTLTRKRLVCSNGWITGLYGS